MRGRKNFVFIENEILRYELRGKELIIFHNLFVPRRGMVKDM